MRRAGRKDTTQAARKAQEPRSRAETALDPLVLLCRSEGLPEPQLEFAFAPDRKFRADYYWWYAKVILEVNGQIWHKGGHSSGKGLLRDYEKSNLAQSLGYRYFQFTPDQVKRAECLPLLKRVLG